MKKSKHTRPSQSWTLSGAVRIHTSENLVHRRGTVLHDWILCSPACKSYAHGLFNFFVIDEDGNVKPAIVCNGTGCGVQDSAEEKRKQARKEYLERKAQGKVSDGDDAAGEIANEEQRTA